MTDMEEALNRIRCEAEAQTGEIDLRGLELYQVPDELFMLTHLKTIRMGLDNNFKGFVRVKSSQEKFIVFRIIENLTISDSDIDSIDFISNFKYLRTLNISGSVVDDLTPLSELLYLESLDFSMTRVTDISPIRKLTNIKDLCFLGAPVFDISSVRGLRNIEVLYCAGSYVNDLLPCVGLNKLKIIFCSACPLENFPEELIWSPSLVFLSMAYTSLPGWPVTGVFSSNDRDNCLPRVRAHLHDLAEGSILDPRIKLLILGNGGAGKTQIASWLVDAGYQLNPDWDSTHGIQVRRAVMVGDPALTLSIWDFGGQDLYHGAHALFLNSPALLLLVWARDTEARGGHGDADLWFRDHPLPYWLSLARHQAHRYSPVLMVQSKCDRVEDRVRPFPVEAEGVRDLPYDPPQLYLSVGARMGREGLAEELRIAANWLRDPTRMGVPRVGKGRVAVRDRMEALRDQGVRLLSMAEFRAVCDAVGGVSAPEHLLTWLDAEGAVFHRPGLFQDQVVLDPSWALEAIYAIFERKSGVVKRIQRQRGRFTRDLLSDTLWQCYSAGEQELFLSMMVSCGICFELREWWEDGERQREYVAPDLLPERKALEGLVPVRWSADAPQREAAYTFPLLHGGLIRTILSRIGTMAGEDALYWRGGMFGYETGYRSRFLIEQEMKGARDVAWSGRIIVRTQDGDAGALLSRLQKIVEEAAAMVGLRGDREQEAALRPPPVVEGEELGAAPPALKAGPEPRTGANWYVSYAWGHDAEGRSLEEKVDLLMTQAASRDVTILRDRNVLRIGDSIRGFMNHIGDGDRIFVVLSDKYLKSPYCMYELYAIWSRSGADPGTFFNRVCLWVHPDVTMRDLGDRMRYAQHWKDRHAALDKQQRKLGLDALSDEDIAEYRYIAEFHRSVSRILFSLFDRVGPRDWDGFLEHGFRP